MPQRHTPPKRGNCLYTLSVHRGAVKLQKLLCIPEHVRQVHRRTRTDSIIMWATIFVVTVIIGGIDAFVCVPFCIGQSGASMAGRTPCNLNIADRAHGPWSASMPWQQMGYKRQHASRLSAEKEASVEDTPFPANFLRGVKVVVETAEEEETRLAKEWADDGRKGRILVRRKEIPSPDLSLAEASRIVFQALQCNDDPMLDYGAAVAIKFASSTSSVRKMTPKDYGNFLRGDPEYSLLVDNISCRPAAKAKVSPDGMKALQPVELVSILDSTKRVANASLVKEDGCWRIDAISFQT